MKVLKFGGTSVGSVTRMREVLNLVNDGEPKIVVLSAMAGTTNTLVKITDLLYADNQEEARSTLTQLKQNYQAVVDELYNSQTFKQRGLNLIEAHFNYLDGFTVDLFTRHEEKAILAQGELLSTSLFQLLAEERKVNAALLPALNFMRINKDAEPDECYIAEAIKREIGLCGPQDIYITQGFICRNSYGEIDNLKRGGSDYTASIIGAAIAANEIQIWTDIDGMHNNDPRFVDDTFPLSELSFEEAAELAYFGAKILHPSSILPVRKLGIPVLLKNTMNPEAKGTIIHGKTINEGTIKAIAAKDNITAIKIVSGRMLLAHGFLRKVFEIFELWKTSIDMVTTSEVAVSLTIDDTTNLDQIVKELEKYGSIEVDCEQTIISMVGYQIAKSNGLAGKIFSSLEHIPVRMISFGGSNHNISMLVDAQHKINALQRLNENLFELV